MELVLVGVLALIAAVGLFVFFNYWPLRKWVYIKTNPRWRELARVYTFPAAEEEAEERSLFVSATVLRDACDVIWHEEDPEPPQALFAELPYGSVVHVNAKHVAGFAARVLPHLRSPIVLVSGYDDVGPNVPGHRAIIDSPLILHWFAQNYDLDPVYLDQGRMTQLPIGLNFHKLEPGGNNTSIDMGLPSRPGNQQLTMKAIRAAIPPLAQRPARAYANFHLNMDTFLRSPLARHRAQARGDALAKLKDKPHCWFEPVQMPRNVVWQRHKDFAFELSPRGNGLDCHRTWEAILLKTVPIVGHSSIDPVYDGLPVIFVDDWSEVTAAALERWQRQYEKAFDGPIPEKLYNRYWIQRFRSYAKR